MLALPVTVGEALAQVTRFLQDTPLGFPAVLGKHPIPRLAVTGDLDCTDTDVAGEIARAGAADRHTRAHVHTRESVP